MAAVTAGAAAAKLHLLRPCLIHASGGSRLLFAFTPSPILRQAASPGKIKHVGGHGDSLCLRPYGSQGLLIFRKGFCATPSAHVRDSGSIDSHLAQSMENKIRENLSAELVTVKDAYGDGRHVSIEVVSSAFEGESAVNRQRMVYKAIWEELQNTVHAVDQMITKTPTEAAVRDQ